MACLAILMAEVGFRWWLVCGPAPARVRVAELEQAGYVSKVLAGSGPLAVILAGRKLTAAELLAIGGPGPSRRPPGDG
jgi:hypothetical protein